MVRLFQSVVLLAFIICIAIIAVVTFFVKFKPSSSVGQQLRPVLIKYPFLVDLINFNQSGDAQFIYRNDTRPLAVEIVSSENAKPDALVETWVTQVISQTTGRSVVIEKTNDATRTHRVSYTDEDLNFIRSNFVSRFPKQTTLRIIYLTSYAEQPTNIGVTIHRDTIFIFRQRIDALSEDQSTRQKLERSTLMHEWGHLLGLEHIDASHCIMSEQVEVVEDEPETIPLEYCQEEVDLLTQL